MAHIMPVGVMNRLQSLLTSTPDNETRSENEPYLPTPVDITVVRIMLVRGKRLPPDLVDAMLDFAEYWAHNSNEVDYLMQHSSPLRINGSSTVENKFMLRSYPVGLTTPEDKMGLIEELAYDMTEAKPYPLGKEHDPSYFAKLVDYPTPKLIRPVRKIVFSIRSKDQGWGGDPGHRGTYDGSWTWFEAGLERFDAEQTCDAQCTYDVRHSSTESKSSALPVCSIRPIHPTIEPVPDSEDKYKYKHPLHHDPKWAVQSNKTATRAWQDHVVTWSYLDAVDPESDEEKELGALGRGLQTGDGALVRDMKMGDVVTLWAKVRYPAWINHIEKATIDVYWARPPAKLPEVARKLPTSGFDVIDRNIPVEEEELPDYRVERFYPVHLGEVFQDRYQVVAKLGFGSSSTIWLARDLREHQYVALKIYVYTSLFHREIPVYEHLGPKIRASSHVGSHKLRRLLDTFEVTGPDGKHMVLVLQPAQMSLRDFKTVFIKTGGFKEEFVRGAIIELLGALDFLHTEAEVLHTDVHPGNLLLGLDDNDLLRRLEDKELTSPVTRKPVSPQHFGEARIGPGPHAGDIMPLEYRAPETLLYIGWSYSVDVWSVALTAWDLLGPKRLFTARDDDGDLYDAAHLAQLIAALGPPPSEFLARNKERASDFWDEKGKWLELAPIPTDRTLEALETRLEDSSGFLKFLRKALTWIPEERATARELLEDPWLRGRKT
ncbi:hypothetical protein G7046_g7410 [Stylonectria norvegica]|nr:hypothetical protein G7046_g7410 [Stylonectria norvegica]